MKDKSATILDNGSKAASLKGSIIALLIELEERFLLSTELDGKTVSITDFKGWLFRLFKGTCDKTTLDCFFSST